MTPETPPPAGTEAVVRPTTLARQIIDAIPEALGMSPDPWPSEAQLDRGDSDVLRAVDALLGAAGGPSGWQPSWQDISTCPRDVDVWLWIVPKSAEEAYTDTSGHPVTTDHAPYATVGRYLQWNGLVKATHWQPYVVPAPPASR